MFNDDSPTNPAEALDLELRFSEQWPGSSAEAIYDQDGNLDGASITIRTDNPYKLMTLLRWLGVGKDATSSATHLPPY
jgi:hypothetical protein